MLYCPLRFPFKASRRLAGGILKSVSERALFNIRSFLKATLWILWGSFRVLSRLKSRSASLSLKLLIINHSITDSVMVQGELKTMPQYYFSPVKTQRRVLMLCCLRSIFSSLLILSFYMWWLNSLTDIIPQNHHDPRCPSWCPRPVQFPLSRPNLSQRW